MDPTSKLISHVYLALNIHKSFERRLHIRPVKNVSCWNYLGRNIAMWDEKCDTIQCYKSYIRENIVRC